MRRIFLSLFAAACLTNMNLSAQITEIAEEGIFSISIGETTMTVDAGHGGKILSFKYGETEILSQSRFLILSEAHSGQVLRQNGTGLLYLSMTEIPTLLK